MHARWMPAELGSETTTPLGYYSGWYGAYVSIYNISIETLTC